jgi:mRNA-degrading endonuclease RelE of RelBE toxin-antitoxin system
VHEVVLPRRARKAMSRFPARDYERVLAAVRSLADDPRPRDSRKMRGAGEEDRRLRVGDYRVVYRIEEPHPDPAGGRGLRGLVTVLSVGHRQGIYG